MSLKERLDEIKVNINHYHYEEAISEMKDIESDYGIDIGMGNFISTDDVDDFVSARMSSGGWQGVACCISDIVNRQNDEYYYIDGYENLEYVKQGTLEAYYSDLKGELSDELEMEDEDEEE